MDKPEITAFELENKYPQFPGIVPKPCRMHASFDVHKSTAGGGVKDSADLTLTSPNEALETFSDYAWTLVHFEKVLSYWHQYEYKAEQGKGKGATLMQL